MLLNGLDGLVLVNEGGIVASVGAVVDVVTLLVRVHEVRHILIVGRVL
jgi:hypothetical protein